MVKKAHLLLVAARLEVGQINGAVSGEGACKKNIPDVIP